MTSTESVRFLIPWHEPSSHPRLASLLQHPGVAAVGLRGAALADASACHALTAAIHATDRPDDLPLLVALSPHGDAMPDELRPPDPRHLALDLAAGGEDFEVTLKVLTWSRPMAEMGVDLVLSPRLDRTPPLDDYALATRLTSAWTEALLAAGLVASAGPWKSSHDEGDAWAPFGAAVAHGLEAVFVDETSFEALDSVISALRVHADDLVVVGPPVFDVDQAEASRNAGVDLIPLADDLVADEIEAIQGAFPSEDPSRVAPRIDRLREDWLV